MKTFQDGIKMLDHQDEVICAAAEERDRITEEIVRQFCPVQIGDVVEVNSGYSFSGKQMKVERITLRKKSWRGEDGFVATGKVLRNDGSVGMGRGEHFAKPR